MAESTAAGEIVDDYNNYTDAALCDLWEEFLESYQQQGDLSFVYMDKIIGLRQKGRKLMTVDYHHLTDYNIDQKFMTLRYMTSYDPEKSRRVLREAVLRVLKKVQPDYANDIEKTFHAEFENADLEKEIPQLNSEDAGKFIKVSGLVTTIDEKSSCEIYSSAWVCDFGHVNVVYGPQKPTRCKGTSVQAEITGEEPEPGEKEIIPCDSIHFTKDEKKSRMQDYIRFEIQQRSERTLESRTPASLQVEVKGLDNVDWIKHDLNFGQLVAVSGIPKTKFQKFQSGSGKTIAEIYLEASSVDVLPDYFLSRDADPALDDIIRDTVRHSIDPEENLQLEHDALMKLIDSICPSLYMTDEEKLLKELILMWLVGSDPLKQPDGTRIRGEGQLLIIGDPGLGKSRIAEYVRLVRPRTMYNAASKSTSVGLVGGLTIDKDGIPKITPGVFGLAKEGAIILDEFAGRPDRDYADMLEPMSDMGTVTIAKGAFYRQFQTNAAVLAIANPSTASRYYNSDKSIFDNTNIPPTILQRFDAIIIKKDIADADEDKARAEHYLRTQSTAVTEAEFNKERPDKWKRREEHFYSADYMKKWVAWVRETYHPRLSASKEACEVVTAWYSKVRQMSISITDEGVKDEKGVIIPAGDMRKLGSVIRFAQMRARCCQRDYVTKEDALRACQYVDLTLAEAGMWKQGKGNQREFLDDKLAQHAYEKAKKDAEMLRAIFRRAIENISFETCYQCRGSGETIELGGEHVGCPNCHRMGHIPIPFSKNDAILQGVGDGKNKVTLPIFNQIWKEWEKDNRLILADNYDHYMNTVPWGGAVPGSKHKTEADKLREKLLKDHPNQWKRFVKNNKYDDMSEDLR